MADQTTRSTSSRDQASVGEVIEYVKAYAKQETVGPLRGAGRWIAYGAAGAILIAFGLMLLLLGLLRVLQTESFGFQSNHWSWVNYVIVIVVCVVFIALAAWRINQRYLNKEDKR
jgi:uncharacterized membrane protein YdbT with pleckstrin-like domain